MPILVAIPLFALLVIIQSALISQVPLLNGTADLILLAIVGWALQERVETAWQWCLIGGIAVSLVSSLPLGTLIAGYAAATGVTLMLKRRIWKVHVLAMLAAIFLGTLIVDGVSIGARWATGVRIPILQAFNIIVLPSLLLNLLFALPAYSIARDVADWLYPKEIEA